MNINKRKTIQLKTPKHQRKKPDRVNNKLRHLIELRKQRKLIQRIQPRKRKGTEILIKALN
jgi:hypothetical protein